MDQLPSPTPETNKFLQRVSGAMAAVGAATLGVMMLISVADVIGRKFFMYPIQGTAELVGMLLVIAASWGLGYCALIKAHIRITIFIERFPRRVSLSLIFSLISWALPPAALSSGKALSGCIHIFLNNSAAQPLLSACLSGPLCSSWSLGLSG